MFRVGFGVLQALFRDTVLGVGLRLIISGLFTSGLKYIWGSLRVFNGLV